MSESEDKKLDFSLPERPAPKTAGGAGAGIAILLVLLLLLVAGNLYLTWTGSEVAPAPSSGRTATLPAKDLKQLALKLEQQGLDKAAAGVWREYLAAAANDKEVQPATIWYRIGSLCQKAGAHEEALEAFYRSESLGGAKELASETGRKVQESLEALGKFAALKHELSARVGLNDDAGAESGKVVAEIGAQKITRAELDRQIEAGIENQLAMFAGQMPDEQRKQQKEAMLRQFATDQQRLQFLNSYIVQEILYRKARESDLVDDPEVRARLRDAERRLLARELMEAELSGKTFVSDADVSIYYEARKNDYVEPATAQLNHILVADEEAARAAIERVLAGEDFAAVAKERSTDAATKDDGGRLPAPAVQGQGFRGMNLPPGSLDPLFEGKAGDILDVPVQSEAGYHVFQLRELTPERQQPLEEVRSQIYAELYRQKEQELQANLLEELRDEYDVVIHQEAFQAAPTAE